MTEKETKKDTRLTLELKRQVRFGKVYYYPSCSFSKTVCAFAKKVTLTTKDLQMLERYFKFDIDEVCE